ncbi:2,3-diphosphoglycerate-dependent phosphoglycerate mutase [Aerococcus sanguinicola]|uniref:2,3-bisphosphoglycerate-dependent phosphoglycerate mutase n=2 Tax=Aerococcus sanguinicola TaxID=119206 RepID=A0A0X8FCW4_9LACT|nr:MULTISPECIES: 2,3-diphosphoglycerate-dependent phosphoglycerate mutase [Aerococcus]AMB94982.1 phosphoglyceromutase [Aerococcus sanguinicola]MDK6232786.1 2,3-diphosphoglycerate-dependent phosphoglycerate mutase [Aerococcus sp. UMB10185]MDK6805265.1 2,3-diphosphoglycerate-dependent phosphoglycerate mutase [Aerococcus sp. UMB7834]MDK6854924.1 2,3-diphosphoglycerate-dependent phosphoglycerate mutase [Aerococcus sp. UMB7533]MDK7050878.1 2,3-diphosphoglycerate-dependent phosphoglycerate mutase [A
MMKLVFIRHGESELNLANVFTGWLDPRLSEKGVKEAQKAGQDLKEAGIEFDTVHTSMLSRAIQTTYNVLDQMDRLYLPVNKNWRLNERHYGGLQGLNKAETAEKYGDEQVHIWRRSFDVRPPLAEEGIDDPRYADLDQNRLLAGECLKDTLARTLPYWEDHIAPELKQGKNVLVVAHGNSLRSITKYLENISDEDIPSVEIATGEPIVYDLDEDLNVVNKTILEK